MGKCVCEGDRGEDQQVKEERRIRVEGKGEEDSRYVQEKVDGESEWRSRFEKGLACLQSRPENYRCLFND